MALRGLVREFRGLFPSLELVYWDGDGDMRLLLFPCAFFLEESD